MNAPLEFGKSQPEKPTEAATSLALVAAYDSDSSNKD